jgi:hypothetical protein
MKTIGPADTSAPRMVAVSALVPGPTAARRGHRHTYQCVQEQHGYAREPMQDIARSGWPS